MKIKKFSDEKGLEMDEEQIILTQLSRGREEAAKDAEETRKFLAGKDAHWKHRRDYGFARVEPREEEGADAGKDKEEEEASCSDSDERPFYEEYKRQREERAESKKRSKEFMAAEKQRYDLLHAADYLEGVKTSSLSKDPKERAAQLAVLHAEWKEKRGQEVERRIRERLAGAVAVYRQLDILGKALQDPTLSEETRSQIRDTIEKTHASADDDDQKLLYLK